jgi:hypothetical protein
MTTESTGRRRTVAITILAILAAIAGIIAIVDVFRYLGLLPMGDLFGVSFFGVSWFGAILSAIVAIIWFTVARQLWNLDPQGWLFVVVIAIVNLIFLLIAILGETSFQAVSWNIIVNALALVLALLPNTRAAFGQR